jgi:hypothetical protein
MKHSIKKSLLIALLIVTVVMSLTAQAAIEQQNVVTDIPQVVTVEETEAQVEDQSNDSFSDGMLLMREEEKLARDVYLALYDIWGIKTFANIARSEQQHMDAMATLLDLHGVDDPVAGSEYGEFKDAHLAELYNQLVELGSKSPADAVLVGATIEDLDIYDLEVLLSETDEPNAVQVYTNLVRGSENHMRSFVRQLAKYNQTYTAQYITESRLLEILNN